MGTVKESEVVDCAHERISIVLLIMSHRFLSEMLIFRCILVFFNNTDVLIGKPCKTSAEIQEKIIALALMSSLKVYGSMDW